MIKILNEQIHKKHCILINIDDNVGEKDRILSQIFSLQNLSREAIYTELPLQLGPMGIPMQNKNESYGIPHPHITLLYGLTNENSFFGLKKFFGNIDPFEIKFGNINIFDNKDEYDVYIIEIKSYYLHQLHNYIKNNFEVDMTYNEYKPHMTIAYVNKGGRPLDLGPCSLTGQSITVHKLIFSHIDGYKLPILIGV